MKITMKTRAGNGAMDAKETEFDERLRPDLLAKLLLRQVKAGKTVVLKRAA